MNRKSVAEAKMPEELTPAMKIEFNVLKSKLTELETQWFRLLDNENPDQKRYGEIVDQEYQSMISHANKLAEVRVNSINAQYNEKKKKLCQIMKKTNDYYSIELCMDIIHDTN